jgi:hypothetical protein
VTWLAVVKIQDIAVAHGAYSHMFWAWGHLYSKIIHLFVNS